MPWRGSGNARRTWKPSPRSRVRGAITSFTAELDGEEVELIWLLAKPADSRQFASQSGDAQERYACAALPGQCAAYELRRGCSNRIYYVQALIQRHAVDIDRGRTATQRHRW